MRVYGQLENSSQFRLYGDADEWAHSAPENLDRKQKTEMERKESEHEQEQNEKKECVCGNIYHSHLYGVFPFRKSTFYEYNARTHSHKKRTKIQNKTKLRAK